MIKSKPLDQQHYETLVDMIRYGEYCSQELDEICRCAIARPAVEKTFFDLFDQYRRINSFDSKLSCCFCIDELVHKIVQALIKRLV